MKNYWVLLLFISSYSLAQTRFSGKVIDEFTKKPIAGVSIYFNNTAIGTNTDNDGNFVLEVKKTGSFELIASHINYKKITILTDSINPQKILISLQSKVNLLAEVVIKSKKNSGDNFNKWGDFFARILFGTTSYGHCCRIKNPNVLVFNYDEETNELNVYTKSPLLINLNELGYDIKLELDNFNYSFNTDILNLNYSAFFQNSNIYNFNKDLRTKYYLKTSRLIAYFNSQMYFMRSAYTNTLTTNGFKLYHYQSIKNNEKERVLNIIQKEIGKKINGKNNPNLDLISLFKDKDTIRYFNLVLKQEDILAIDTQFVNPIRVRTFNKLENTVKINFKDTLLISYIMPLATELKTFNYLKDTKEIEERYKESLISMYKNELKKNNISLMYFTSPGGLEVESNGYVSATNLFVLGKMFERRIGLALPWDFDPDFP